MVIVTEVQRSGATFAGPIELRLPAEPMMSRVLRLAASGVASLSGYSVAEIEDIKIAVSEVLIALIEHGDGNAIDVRLVVDSDAFVVEGATEVRGPFDLAHPDLRLCRTVLAGVCTEHVIEHIGSVAKITAVLRRPFPAG